MPMIMCDTGKHFYNPDVHAECPSCKEDEKNDLGSLDQENQVPKTDKVEAQPSGSAGGRLHDQVPKTQLRKSRISKEQDVPAGTHNPFEKKEVKQGPKGTQIILGGRKYESGKMIEHSSEALPVTGWLVIVEGQGKGRDFRLIQGENRIGRNDDMEVCLNFGGDSDETVSREAHAIVVFDGNANEFFVERGSSRNLPMLNGKSIRRDQNLSAKDVLQVGQTKLLFIPLCGESFQW